MRVTTAALREPPVHATAHAAAPAAAAPGDGAIVGVRRGPLVGYVPEGETILLAIRPSVLFLLLFPLWAYAGLAVLGFVLWVTFRITGLGLDPSRAAWMAGIAILLRFAWAALEWVTRLYVLTDRRLITVAGVLRQGVSDLPLTRIQHVTLHKSLRERVFGLGTLAFATAGTGGYDAAWRMLDRPARTMHRIREAIAHARGPGSGPGSGSSPGSGAGTDDEGGL